MHQPCIHTVARGGAATTIVAGGEDEEALGYYTTRECFRFLRTGLTRFLNTELESRSRKRAPTIVQSYGKRTLLRRRHPRVPVKSPSSTCCRPTTFFCCGSRGVAILLFI